MVIPGIALLLLLGYLSACAGASRWITLREFLAFSTCSHPEGLEFVRNIYGDAINEWGGKRSLWKCSRCGKLQARDELFKSEDHQ